MTIELDVLRTVSERLDAARISFMITGSVALAYYATPRMTRDIDIVVALSEQALDALAAALADDFYLDLDAAREAIRNSRLFNLMHYSSAIKIDLIIRKSGDYRLLEFDRRQRVTMAGVSTWIVSREDLVLSKLEWARDSRSELQQRDVRALLAGPVDWGYLGHWARQLGLESALAELSP
jgi:hypothetical protein